MNIVISGNFIWIQMYMEGFVLTCIVKSFFFDFIFWRKKHVTFHVFYYANL
jgi:hypothetical protein